MPPPGTQARCESPKEGHFGRVCLICTGVERKGDAIAGSINRAKPSSNDKLPGEFTAIAIK